MTSQKMIQNRRNESGLLPSTYTAIRRTYDWLRNSLTEVEQNVFTSIFNPKSIPETMMSFSNQSLPINYIGFPYKERPKTPNIERRSE